MKQPKQHSIGRLAGRCFEASLPAHWPTRKQSEDDYGIDYEVEVFKPEENLAESTGIIFKAQIKGTKSIQVSSDNKVISHSLDIENGTYLLEEIKIPAIFVVCDVESGECYWTELQSNKEILRSYYEAKENRQKSFTIHIPISSKVQQNHQEIINGVSRCFNALSVRQFMECSIQEFITATELTDEERLIAEMDVKRSVLEYRKIEKLIAGKDKAGISKIINTILGSSDTPIELKYAATMAKENLFLLRAYEGEEDRNRFYEVRLEIMQEAFGVVKDGPEHLKSLTSVFISAAELQIFCYEDYHLYINLVLQQEKPESYWLLEIMHRRSILANEIVDKFNECNMRLRDLFVEGYYSVFPEAAGRISESIIQLVLRLRIEGLKETAMKFVAWADSKLNLAREISRSLELWSSLGMIAQEKTLLTDLDNPEDIEQRFKIAEEWIDSIPDENERERAKKKLLEVKSNFDKTEL
ncbi:hypothetical protein ES703_28769 [subsurface metagenome]